MRCVILSQGPSARLYDGGYADRLVCVNRQAALWPCDWWAFNDAATFRQVEPKGNPALWTKAAVLSELADANVDQLARFRGYSHRLHEEAVISLWDLEARWNLYSGLAAFGLAIIERPDELDLYGYDMTGSTDFGGQANSTREPARWEVEARIFDRLLACARRAGIVVRRHGV